MHIDEKHFARTKWYCLSIVLTCIFQCVSSVVYSDQFVIQMDGGATLAKRFVEDNGFIYLGQIFEDHYHIKHKKITKRSAEQSIDHSKLLSKDSRVKWVSQQIVKKRVKRNINSVTKLNDPKWPEMWYLNRGKGLDMNVQAAWAAGATGKDIVVTILDDGLEKDHPDIVQNYDPNASYDVNNRDADPQPRYDFLDSNRHGTRCAGEVAASANNSLCSVGVAYEARVGGVRMLDGDVTDAVEARSLSLNPQHIDIYSASWGPDDDGKTVDGPGDLATRAFKEGIEKGRKGLGSIFVWASGNGGRERDNCNCDGYTNAIWTLSISSATENGLVPWYSEACSSTLATTYSSGSSGEKQIITTDLHHGCTTTHTGTSASAPLAAGICALALEVNKQLTWRDMQHIVVRTAKPANLFARDWKTNGVGRNVSHSFGYGMMDAAAMVRLARSWTTVPPQKMCEVRAQHMDKQIQQKSKMELSLEVHCENVHFLEHVQAKISLSATRRGDIQIFLTSPSGTKSTLLAQRHSDNSRSGFQAWPFMTVHNWGENPNGVWKLEIHSDGHYAGRASLKDWSLLLYGTTENPDHSNNDWNAALSNPTYPTTNSVSFLHDVPVTASKLPIASVEDNSLPQKAFLPQGSLFRGLNENEYLFPLPVGPHKTRENPENSSSLNSGCALMDASGLCLDCQAHLYLAQGQCFPACPDGHYTSSHPSVQECLRCHYSCRKCVGSNDYQCTECYGDAELQDSMYCRPRELLLELRGFTTWYAAMTTAFVLLCVVVLGLVAAVVAGRNHGLFTCCKKETTYSTLSTPSSKMSHPGEGQFSSRRVYSDSDEEV